MPLAEAAELPLRQGAEGDDVFGVAGDDRRGGVAHGPGHTATAAAPVHVGELDLRNAESPRQPCGVVAVIAIRGKPVDIFDPQTGISDRLLDSFERQLELADRRLTGLVITGFAD